MLALFVGTALAERNWEPQQQHSWVEWFIFFLAITSATMVVAIPALAFATAFCTAAAVAYPEDKRAAAAAVPHELVKTLRPVEAVDGNGVACVVCHEYRASICLVPCGHQILCDECTLKWWYQCQSAGWPCPICRTGIERVVRPFH